MKERTGNTMEVYDAKKDEEFSKGYIDVDEMRVRVLDDGTKIPFHYMHGGFEGTDVKFSFCFPEKDRYEGRFYQYLSPFPGPEEELASLPVTGIDDKIGFCLTHGAYYVESNMGSREIFTNSDDRTMTHRSSAASAEFSRIKAQEVYGYEHRPYGYVYGGSGGGYRTIACIENTNAFDGAVPYVIGSPYAIPNCQTTRAHAERLLRSKMPQIIDAVDAGGSGDPYQGLNEEEAAIDRETCAELSGEIEAECAVLLKNEGVLPLNEADSVAFIGQFYAAPRYQGAGSSHINVPHAISALEAIRNASASVLYAPGYDVHDIEVNDALLQEAVTAAKAVKTAVVFVGLPDSFETEGDDRTSLALPANQNALVEAVAEANPNTVVVYHGGSCAELPWISKVKAVLCMYLGGSSVGTATVQLLYGKKNPSGKLTETWPLKLADNPSYLNFPGEDGVVEYHEDVFIGYRYYDKKQMDVLFPFGHGLSYSSFAYSDLALDKTSMEDTDVLTVTCKVKNTGRYAGKEVVQLYVGEVGSVKVRRPIRELKGFEKVSLAPGEEQTVTFHLDKRAFAYYETKIYDWFVESGRYQIEVGTSSRNLCLSAAVDVHGTAELPMIFNRCSTVGEVMKTAAGRKLIETIASARRKQRGGADLEAAQAEAMGEGSERMMEKMMYEMSLNNLVTYGVMTFDQLDELIDGLNS